MRLKYLDVLKSIAIFGVVVIHSAAPLVDRSIVVTSEWWVGNVYDSLFRISVPLLFMVSGALLLEKKEVDLKRYYLKRVIPLLFAFLVWSVIYFIQRNLNYPESFTIRNLARSILAGDIYGRLWFFYTIIGIYLITPFLRLFVQNARDGELKLYLILWFVSTTGIGYFNHFHGIDVAVNMSFVYGYVGYFILGYYLRMSDLQIKKLNAALLLLILNIVTIVGTFILSNANGTNNLYFYNNLSPNIILTTLVIFIAAKSSIKGESKRFEREVSNNSLGIYVIHSFVMIWLAYVGIDSFFMNPISAVLILSILTFVISFILSKVLKFVPFIKYILP